MKRGEIAVGQRSSKRFITGKTPEEVEANQDELMVLKYGTKVTLYPVGGRVGNYTVTDYGAYDKDNRQYKADDWVDFDGSWRWVHGGGSDEALATLGAGGTWYHHQDGLGSVVALSGAGGALVERVRYDAFGQPEFVDAAGQPAGASLKGNRFLFTGREWFAALGLQDNRHRYYQPSMGRWLSRDPIGEKGGINLYSYVGNTPNMLVDPAGLCKVEIRYAKIGINWYHAYIVVTDIDGTQTYYRGGPSAGGPSSGASGATGTGGSGASSGNASNSSGSNGGSSGSGNSSSPGASPGGGGNNGSWGPLTALSGPYLPGTIDWDSGAPPSQTLLNDNNPCKCFKALNDYVNHINNTNIPYNPFSTNSNAFAQSAAQSAGFAPAPPPVWTPGTGTKLP